MKKNNVYNAVCYDGVDAYCTKVIAKNEMEVIATFKDTDLKVVFIDYLYEWDNLDKHIAGALRGEWELADGDIDMAMAIKRVVRLRTGMDLFGQFA